MYFSAPTESNYLLSLLSPETLARIDRDLERVNLRMHQTLSQPVGAIKDVYFPVSGIVSLVPEMEQGATLQVGIIGREGFLGVPLLLGGQAASSSAIVQADGVAMRMPAKAFLSEIKSNALFMSIAMRYAQYLMSQLMRAALCNRHHDLSRRLSRWLLEAHDRLSSDEIRVSHAFLGIVLGARRSGVTVALGALNGSGFIGLTQGLITVLNRGGIEATACDCYQLSKSDFALLFPS